MDNGITFSPAGIAVITVLLGSVAGALGVIFKLLMASKEAQLADMKGQRDNAIKVAEKAADSMEAEADRILARWAKVGIAIPKSVQPVEPDHNSPVTEQQQKDADYATVKARVAIASKVFEDARKLEEAKHPAPEDKATLFESTIVLEGPVVLMTDSAVIREKVALAKKPDEDPGSGQIQKQPGQ